MTLTLTPDAEARLRSVAAQRGLPPEQTIEVLLAEADTDFQQAVAGIQRGIDDFAAGHWISLEDYEAQVKQEQYSPSIKRGRNNLLANCATPKLRNC